MDKFSYLNQFRTLKKKELRLVKGGNGYRTIRMDDIIKYLVNSQFGRK
ncbi:ComC/BlpC family leader-containing pheromone/bacteriocin [Streptococcus oricebi]|uniref:Uncharacterized protein n=1 Tax=Streptococcus oricebi TaxID=1547447 RepID=A0ABS5B5K4_9STRE|nr:hypothetical protein [Streptococcus oricebi]